MLRYVLNFFITGLVVMLFQAFGWLEISKSVGLLHDPLFDGLLVAGVVGAIFTFATWLAAKLYGLAVVLTCGLGCLLYPMFIIMAGPIAFWLVNMIIPGWVIYHASFWGLVGMGLALAILRIPDERLIRRAVVRKKKN